MTGRVERTLSRTRKALKKEGFYHVVRASVIRIFDLSIGYDYYKIFKPSGTFAFQGETYNYLCHKYNRTWRNERAVEVPIVWEILRKHHGKKILEVGNVLAHYFPVNHDIVDKYERVDGVINQDVVDFQPFSQNNGYDLIVSISTLEHVGWDENPREPTKILPAIENLKSCLASGGKIVVTLPLGYNCELDRLLNEGKIQFTKIHCLTRASTDNKWVEVDWKSVRDPKYHSLLFYSDSLIIGIIEKR